MENGQLVKLVAINSTRSQDVNEITQDELVELSVLRLERQKLNRKIRSRQHDIQRRLNCGAKIESGLHTIEFKHHIKVVVQ